MNMIQTVYVGAETEFCWSSVGHIQAEAGDAHKIKKHVVCSYTTSTEYYSLWQETQSRFFGGFFFLQQSLSTYKFMQIYVWKATHKTPIPVHDPMLFSPLQII